MVPQGFRSFESIRTGVSRAVANSPLMMIIDDNDDSPFRVDTTGFIDGVVDVYLGKSVTTTYG